MISSRYDLTEWSLHFIHDYNSNAQPDDSAIDFNYFGSFPYHHDKSLNDRFDAWRISDEYYPIDPDPDALQVLLKIITDGHIRASWAFRKGRPTVYGPRAAVCFTEMPLYALLEYANQRESDSVGTYAVGVLKRELFAAGGRPVIYGLSTKHMEHYPGASRSRVWPRFLASSCGLSKSEQYRYVAMSDDLQRPIDWTHEREWRWVDHQDKFSCPGLPIWLSDEHVKFSRIFVVVPDSKASERVLGRLQQLHDTGTNEMDFQFCRDTLKETSVVALDQLRDVDRGRVRLENIPASYINSFDRPRVSPEFIEEVRVVLTKARAAADQAAAENLRTAKRTEDGFVADIAGWAHLVVRDSQSTVVAALLQLREASGSPGVGYFVGGIGGLGWRNDQALSLAEASVRAAKTVFEEHFPDVSFGIDARWD